jgi:hypothetical protein
MRYVQTVKNPEERSQPRRSLGRAKAKAKAGGPKGPHSDHLSGILNVT